jgi:hypothetical protein
MKEDQKERWRELLERAATEQDSKRFNELIREVNRLLAIKHAHPDNGRPAGKDLAPGLEPD